MTQGERRALKTKTEYSSETSVEFQRATRHCTPEARTLHNNRCKHLKSHLLLLFCSVYSSTLKIEAACSSEPSANFYPASWCHVPEDSLLLTKAARWLATFGSKISKRGITNNTLWIVPPVRRASLTTRVKCSQNLNKQNTGETMPAHSVQPLESVATGLLTCRNSSTIFYFLLWYHLRVFLGGLYSTLRCCIVKCGILLW
jgi:hypothetical protein